MAQSPPSLLGAAGVQAAEAVLVLIATVLGAIGTATPGRTYQVSSGIALTVIGAGLVVVLAVIARGLARARRWSRTPALLAQFFVGLAGINLIQGGRYEWGVPGVILAVAGFAAVLVPPSMRALTREQEPGEATPPSGK